MQPTRRTFSPPTLIAAAVLVIAFVTGLPSLRGGFLAGDDYHLVLNHILVNHPSLPHALEILTILHRDLYQPIPLLSFSLDFALINAFGLLPTPDGPAAGAWLFHLTNVGIHALNALLVFHLITRLTPRRAVAALAALLFAVHPLAAEPIAWLNGRMMLLSTCFTLLTVIAFDRWNDDPRPRTAGLTLLLTFLAHMSKVSVALPVLVAVCPFARRRKPQRRWWILWAVVALITGAFTLLNIGASSEMFVIAEGEMEGSRFLYCLLALGQYFRQFIVPVGLSVWYPPPPDLAWTLPSVRFAFATVALVALLTLLSTRRTRVGLLGMLWFMAAVFPTLPVVPARRAIGADRYVYLPMIGLAWIAATLLVALYDRLVASSDPSAPTRSTPVAHERFAVRRAPLTVHLLRIAVAAVAVTLVAVSWRTQSYHRDDIAAALRNIETNPDFPGVYKQAAWAYYRHGQYENAIDIAYEDLEHHPDAMACEVYQVVGMSRFRLGQYDRALAALDQAIRADPKFGKCYSRLALIQAHLNQTDDAIANYERAVEIMPFYNPALIPLANLYRTVDRTDDAIHTYRQAIENNPYEVPAHLGLAEIDIQRHRYQDAVDRLTDLLGWMPENAVARTNLGVAYEALGRNPEAVAAFTRALRDDPGNAVAAVNLANLYARAKRYADALRLYQAQMPTHGTDLDFLIAHHDFALSLDRPDLTAAAFINAYNQSPDDSRLRVWTAYALTQAADWGRAAKLLAQHPLSTSLRLQSADPAETTPRVPDGQASPRTDLSQMRQHPDAPVYLLTALLLSLHDRMPDLGIAAVDHLLAVESPAPADALQRALADLERFAAADPADPWPYFHTAQILRAQMKPDLAALALQQFTHLCPTPDCKSRARQFTP